MTSDLKVYAISKQASERLFDVIVYGATGFTGKEICKYLCKTASPQLKWAIAGRSQAKLGSLKSHLLGTIASGSLPEVLVSDADDTRTLQAMFAETRLVLNCTGPYRFLGRQVVEACLVVRADYMDICGEPQFMESCFLDYHAMAVDKGVCIVHACAFDSVPADLGCLFTQRQFGPQCCTSIESFLHISCPKGLKAHYTTFESAVHGVADAGTLKEIRKSIETKYKPPPPQPVGPKLKRNTGAYFDKRVNKYAIPFLGADASVVRSSHRSLSLRSGSAVFPQYAAYACLNSLYWVATAGFFGGLFSTLASFEMGRSLLLACPEALSHGVFSKDGPSRAQLEQTSFEMHFYAQGYAEVEGGSGEGQKDESGGGEGSGEAPGAAATEGRESTEAPDSSRDSKGAETQIRRGKEIIPTTELAGTSTVNRSCDFGYALSPASSAALVPSPRPVDRRIHTVVTGPEPGYVATPAIFVALAMSMLEQRPQLPRGGVLTPASAWEGVDDVFERLSAAGIGFRVVGHNWDDGIKKSANVDAHLDPADEESLTGQDGEEGEGEEREKAAARGSAISGSEGVPTVTARALGSGDIYIHEEGEKK